jgi:hypothetical protein
MDMGNSIKAPCLTIVSGTITSVVPAFNTWAKKIAITEKTICNGKICTE